MSIEAVAARLWRLALAGCDGVGAVDHRLQLAWGRPGIWTWTGILVDPDHEKSLAADPDLRRRLDADARARVRAGPFGWDSKAAWVAEVLPEVAAQERAEACREGPVRQEV